MPKTLTNQQLEKLRSIADPGKTIGLPQSYSGYRLKLPSVIKNYHDLLLFFCAFPGNNKIYTLAITELTRISETIKEAWFASNTRVQKSLMGTGIVHTELFCSYSYPISRWLIKVFPGSTELGSSDASKDTVRNIIQLLAPAIEYEKSTQGELGLPARLKQLTGMQKPAEQLKWLLQLFENSNLPEPVKEDLFQQLKVFIRLKLDNETYNRTFLRSPVKELYYQGIFPKKNVTGKEIVTRRTGKPATLSPSEKLALLNVIKATLAFQYREIDPVTYGDEEELELFEVERGLQIALVGMKKEKRLSLESYVGFMAFKNGVPVSYGGGWIWGRRCKIGVNIFPAFRRGESAWLFCQVLRIYYDYFGIRHFVVKPYQFGKGNPEGLKSGAFWFYYKLGFRPANDKIRKEADQEWEKIQTIKNYRTPIKVLQHFTGCHKELILNKKSVPDFDASKISMAISQLINRDFNCSRKKALATCLREMTKRFPVSPVKKNSPYQKQVLENWSLLAALINDLEEWNFSQKRDLANLVRLKQSGKEVNYITGLQKHTRLWKSLQEGMTKGFAGVAE